MKLGNFTGIPGIPEPGHRDVGDDGPDRRPLARPARRAATSRSSSSGGVMVDAVQALRGGRPALGADVPRTHLRSFEGIVPKGTDWRTLGETPAAEPAAAD